MTLSTEMIDFAVKNFPKGNIEESETVLAQYLLFNEFSILYPNYPKLIFYIVLDRIYGVAKLKDKNGFLGRKLKVIGKNINS